MNALQTASAAAMFIVAGFIPAVAPAQGGGNLVIVTPADLKWADVPSLPPGAKIAVIEGAMNEAKPFTVRLKFPANYKIPAHSHPAVEHVTVMSGTFHLGAGDKLDPKQTRALTPGSVAVMQPNTRHFAWTDAETIVQLHGMGPWGVAYVAPADDPRKN